MLLNITQYHSVLPLFQLLKSAELDMFELEYTKPETVFVFTDFQTLVIEKRDYSGVYAQETYDTVESFISAYFSGD